MSISQKARFAMGLGNSPNLDGHAFRGHHHTEEAKARIARAARGRIHPELRALKGKPRPQEVRDKISASLKLRTGPLTPMFGKCHSEETKAKMRIARRNNPTLTKETCISGGKAGLGWHHSELTKAKIGSANKIALRGRHISKETRGKISAAIKALWRTPEWIAKRARAECFKPNKAEIKLQSILDRYFPGEWRFVGDGQLVIGGKIPDFANVNGKKAVIELFGVHWHSLFDVATRTEHFRQYGFKTIIIWDDELKDEDRLAKRVRRLTC